MINTYIKPETKTIKVELQQMIADSLPTVGEIENPLARENNFDFFMEEEETPGKSDDEDWEDWEEEDDP